jgi:hypothetical protein
VQLEKSQEMLVEPEARVARETKKLSTERKRAFDLIMNMQSEINRMAASCPQLPLY